MDRHRARFLPGGNRRTTRLHRRRMHRSRIPTFPNRARCLRPQLHGSRFPQICAGLKTGGLFVAVIPMIDDDPAVIPRTSAGPAPLRRLGNQGQLRRQTQPRSVSPPRSRADRATGKRSGAASFVEIFSWRDEHASTEGHWNPQMMAIREPIIPILESRDLAIIEAAWIDVELGCNDADSTLHAMRSGLSDDLRQVHNFRMGRHTTPPG